MATPTQIERFVAEFEHSEGVRVQNAPAWLAPLRKGAISRFAELGFPGPRDEEWRFINISPIVQGPFKLAKAPGRDLTPDHLRPYLLEEVSARRLVFVDGHHVPELSSVGGDLNGVRIESLARALRERPADIKPHLARYARHQDHPFTALNTAFLEDGAFVYVPKGTVVEAPIHLVFVSTARSEATVSHPRALIVAEANSQSFVLESYVGLGDGTYFTNPVTELVAGPDAVVDHCKLQRESPGAFHVARLQLHQSRGSSVLSHSIAAGGAIVRNDVNAVLDGEGADCALNGLFIAGGRQQVDNHLRVEHAKPHGDSREFYKGILDGQARGVFTGRIVVHKDAQKTDAKQTNMNLLLSETAQIDTKPQLEIFADDVKCTHGATIGQLSKDAIFYLRTRGLSEPAARSLLTYAFAGECIERIENESLRSVLEGLLRTWLPQGVPLTGVLE